MCKHLQHVRDHWRKAVNKYYVFCVAGWFSVVSNNSGTGSARVYRRIGALVRAGVPAFLLAKPLRAYTLTHSKMGKWQKYNISIFKVIFKTFSSSLPHFTEHMPWYFTPPLSFSFLFSLLLTRGIDLRQRLFKLCLFIIPRFLNICAKL